MLYTSSDVLEYINENDVKFVRLAFCDIFGVQKNISISPRELSRAFETGISFDASAVKGFLNVEKSDLLLFPDPTTLTVLPWRPSHGRVVRMFCDIRYPDGSDFIDSSRHILKQAVLAAKEMGYTIKIGSECEFYLFRTDENDEPTFIPHDNGSYCDVSPIDKGENVRRDICLTLEEMNIIPETSHHEQGPGQNEIDFKYSDALTAADNLITFKGAVKTIAARNGLYASFMPKPFENKSGNGLHINISLFKDGKNLFNENGVSGDAECFMQGILSKMQEITLFLNPTTNSYKRFGEFEAPEYISWSQQNRAQLIRIPAAKDDLCRMELRSPDPTCNPYLAFAIIIFAGLEGIKNMLPLDVPISTNEAYTSCKKLPSTLGEAVSFAERSEFLKKFLPVNTLLQYISEKKTEFENSAGVKDIMSYERDLYFNIL